MSSLYALQQFTVKSVTTSNPLTLLNGYLRHIVPPVAVGEPYNGKPVGSGRSFEACTVPQVKLSLL